jgi:hypothetical protein
VKDKQKSLKQPKTSRTSDQAEASEGPFQLGDLIRITFTISGTEYDCWTSTAIMFQAYVGQFSTTSNVDTKKWDVFERLDFLNDLSAFCAEKGFTFPFAVKEPAESAEQRDAVK